MKRPTLTLWNKELFTALQRRATWIIFAVCAALCGGNFILILRSSSVPAHGLPSIFCTSLCLATPLVAAFFSMNAFSHSHGSGSLEALLTAPITETEVTIGKFLAAFSLVFLSQLFSCLIFYIYLQVGSSVEITLPPLLGGLAIVALVAASLTAFGILTVLLVRNSAAAAAISAVLGIAFVLLITENFLGLGFGPTIDLFRISDFARGIADTRPIVLCFTSMCLFLFCAVRVLESRRWLTGS